MSAEDGDKRAQDLELTSDEADRVKGGVNPIEGGGDAGSPGFSLGGMRWKMRRKKKKQSSGGGSTAGGRPV